MWSAGWRNCEWQHYACSGALCVVAGMISCMAFQSPLVSFRVSQEARHKATNTSGLDDKLRATFVKFPELLYTRDRYLSKTCFPGMDEATWTTVFRRHRPNESCSPPVEENGFCAETPYCITEYDIFPRHRNLSIWLLFWLSVLAVWSLVIIFCPIIDFACETRRCALVILTWFILKAAFVVSIGVSFQLNDIADTASSDPPHYGFIRAHQMLSRCTTKTYSVGLLRVAIATELLTVLFQASLCCLLRCHCSRSSSSSRHREHGNRQLSLLRRDMGGKDNPYVNSQLLGWPDAMKSSLNGRLHPTFYSGYDEKRCKSMILVTTGKLYSEDNGDIAADQKKKRETFQDL